MPAQAYSMLLLILALASSWRSSDGSTVCIGFSPPSHLYCGVFDESSALVGSITLLDNACANTDCAAVRSNIAPAGTDWNACVPCAIVATTTSSAMTSTTVSSPSTDTSIPGPSTTTVRATTAAPATTAAASASSSHATKLVILGIVIGACPIVIVIVVLCTVMFRNKMGTVGPQARPSFAELPLFSVADLPATLDDGFDGNICVPTFVPNGGEIHADTAVQIAVAGANEKMQIVIFSGQYQPDTAKNYTGPFLLPIGVFSLRAFVITASKHISAASNPAVFVVQGAQDDLFPSPTQIFSFEPMLAPPMLNASEDVELNESTDDRPSTPEAPKTPPTPRVRTTDMSASSIVPAMSTRRGDSIPTLGSPNHQKIGRSNQHALDNASLLAVRVGQASRSRLPPIQHRTAANGSTRSSSPSSAGGSPLPGRTSPFGRTTPRDAWMTGGTSASST